MSSTPEDFKEIVDKSKCVLAMAARGWAMAATPLYLSDNERRVGAGSSVRIQRKDGSYYDLDTFLAQEAIGRARDQVGQFSIFMADLVGAEIAMLYDIANDNGLRDKGKPEMEFLRHIRNAVSHGNKFKFENDEPRRPAKFRQFEITKGLDGTVCVLGFLGLGDVLDLIDAVRALV